MDISDLFALAISILALVFSMCQFFIKRIRNIREATIHAFEELERDVF